MGDGVEGAEAELAELQRGLAEVSRALHGSPPPQRDSPAGRLEDALKNLSRQQWEQALDAFSEKSPLGYHATWHETMADAALGKRLGFRGWHDSRLNYTGDARVYLSSRALEAITASEAKRAIALYYPFVEVIPLASLGIAGPVADMGDPARRDAAVRAFGETLERFRGRRVIPESAVETPPEALEAAICYSALAEGIDRKKLQEQFVAIAAIVPDAQVDLVERRLRDPDAVNPMDAAQADAIVEAVRNQEGQRFDWLVAGEGVSAPKVTSPLSMGEGQVEGLAATADTSQWIYGFGYLYGLFGFFVALGACGTKARTGLGLLAFFIALAGTYVPLGAMFGLDALQKRSGTRPLARFARRSLVAAVIVTTPLVWAASFFLIPSD